jgi:multidrug efflux pump subunit AcrB
LNSTSDIVDVDWMTEDNQTEYKLEVDKEKAMLNGVAPQQIVGNLTYLMKEYPISNLMTKILMTM